MEYFQHLGFMCQVYKSSYYYWSENILTLKVSNIFKVLMDFFLFRKQVTISNGVQDTVNEKEQVLKPVLRSPGPSANPVCLET